MNFYLLQTMEDEEEASPEEFEGMAGTSCLLATFVISVGVLVMYAIWCLLF